MKRKLLSLVIFILIFSAFAFQKDITRWYGDIKNNFQKVEKIAQNKIITPPPLRAKQEYQESILTRSGVINWTNSQRVKDGLSALKENYQLNLSAMSKAKDILAKQYFEHVSPSGVNVGDLVSEQKYDYIIIGENLALGNFKNDEDLVQAWMDSPGHRANILNNRYRDIGVAVVRGNFEGRMTWVAVQHFGLSVDACTQPDKSLKQSLEEYRVKLDAMLIELKQKKLELDSYRSRKNEDYNKKVDEYNSLANQYNQLLVEIKNLTVDYNSQVNDFNRCLEGFK